MIDFKQIDIREAKEIIEGKDTTIVDIRDPGAFDSAHIKNAVLVNEQNIKNFLKEADKEKPLVCYCYHGLSSQNAAEFFVQSGFKNVYSIKGGFEEWKTVYPSVSSS